ncbi:MAG: TMEM165/GDT1 family protein [Sphingobium sp.]|nr:TMEM165/GDT1 family protein [Sphingobium sp.]MBP6112659.1 TMEM165/GDT1 family protein [Sphingobium sp.]MBP8670550.1 TMEM165/GDT1 family protein [Sphingobium sp.]MBP9157653.1 TMEM165/GDT1 family protein [Sphingobium sp.]MCC6481510.1 TMEM165/GDT1 family protein [Sphingomonadaceae bacterium]
MDSLFTSAALVALAEMGDKTQLLAILLASRFRRPWPIIAGIFAATLLNHYLAALVGHGVAELLDSPIFRIVVALGFIGMGLWTLVPDKMDENELKTPGGASVFMSTFIAFFLVEMGDKTQIATIALGAQFGGSMADVALVTLGTTLGMMIANVPAVLLGEALVKRVPLSLMRRIAATLFVSLGLWMLGSASGWW